MVKSCDTKNILQLQCKNVFYSTGPFSPGEDDHPPHGLPSPPPHLRNIAEREHMRAMEAAHHVMEEAKKRMEEVQRNAQQQALPLSKVHSGNVFFL